MNTSDRLADHAAELADALVALEETLQALSGACYQLAADASPMGGLSREQGARLMGALHDVGAGLARGARVCRDGRATIGPLIDDNQRFWFESRVLPPQPVA
jgi:hypothetical protein